MKWTAIFLMALLTGCNSYHAGKAADCDGLEVEQRKFIIECTKANQVHTCNTHSPEDMVTTCGQVFRQTCPKRFFVDSVKSDQALYDRDEHRVSCDDAVDKEQIEACRKAGWKPGVKS